MSKYKFDIVREVTAADERQSLISYAFPLMRYHDRWKEIDWTADPEPLMEHSFKKGNVYLRDIAPQVYPENFMLPTGETLAFNESAKGYIEKLPSDGDKRESRLRVCNKYFAYSGDQNDFIEKAVETLRAESTEEELEVFAGVSIDQIEIRRQKGIPYRILSLSQYLSVYRASEKDGYRVCAPPMKYCTDNAAMVASCAYFNTNTFDDVDVEVFSRA